MSPGEQERFATLYGSALGDHLQHPGEDTLWPAYELGREAISHGLSVLELGVVHHEALRAAIDAAPDRASAQAVARAAGDFFLESLSSFEMVQRGFNEARQSLKLERRNTALSRRLSTFLADASLALEGSATLEEMLQLVAEQARELVRAECSVVTVAAEGQPRAAQVSSHQEHSRRWMTLARWVDLPAIYACLRSCGDSVRLEGERLAELGFFTHGTEASPRGWLAASLTTLDGGELGAIQLFDKQEGAFSVDDEAAVVHLAQMASATIERARLYWTSG